MTKNQALILLLAFHVFDALYYSFVKVLTGSTAGQLGPVP
jgi:hypothetical protein